MKQIAPSAAEKTSALGLVEQRLKVTITPQSPSDLLLRPSYTLEVEFTLDKQENQLVLPKTAVFSTKMEMRYGLYAKEKRLSSPSGFKNDTEIAVTEGLQEGKTIKPLAD